MLLKKKEILNIKFITWVINFSCKKTGKPAEMIPAGIIGIDPLVISVGSLDKLFIQEQ